MAKLKIIKLALKTWKHNSDVDGDFILTKFYAKQEDNEFLIVERYGAKRRKYKISEIEVYDIGGSAETFTTFEDLFLRLEALNYTAFYQEGEVIFDPTNYDLADFSNSSANPFVSTTQLNNGLATKENTIPAGTTSQYFRGDKTFQTLDKTAVGLSNVDNTSDADKPISNATQTALDGKFNTPTGTANRLAKFATANTIGDSQIFDNGTNVGIGTTAPSARFEILAQGATGSTRVFGIRNSINSIDIILVRGNGAFQNSGGFANNTNGYADSEGTSTGNRGHADSGGITQGTYAHSNSQGKANGTNSHANSAGTANGSNSFASTQATANGNSSFASGSGVLANSFNESAFGIFNENVTPQSVSGSNPIDLIFSIGVGSSDTNRLNAISIFKNGMIKFLSRSLSNITNAVKGSFALDNDARAFIHNGTEWQRVVYTNDINVIRFSSTEPAGVEGAIYFNTTTKKHRGFNGTTWNDLY